MLAIFSLGGGEVLLLLGILPLCLLAFAFWIWMLIDCLQNQRINGNEKVAWVVAIALTHWIGALIYFVAGRKKAV